MIPFTKNMVFCVWSCNTSIQRLTSTFNCKNCVLRGVKAVSLPSPNKSTLNGLWLPKPIHMFFWCSWANFSVALMFCCVSIGSFLGRWPGSPPRWRNLTTVNSWEDSHPVRDLGTSCLHVYFFLWSFWQNLSLCDLNCTWSSAWLHYAN